MTMTQNRMTKIFNKKGGCNEDCFNCPFPDCYKPVSEMECTRNTMHISRVDKESGESQAKMFTVMLGGYGGARPNLSKKFLY